MKKLVLLALVFALLLTACSNWSIEIKDPQSQEESGAQSSAMDSESSVSESSEISQPEEFDCDPFKEYSALSYEQVYELCCKQEPAHMQNDWLVNAFGKSIWVFGGKDGNVPLTAAIADGTDETGLANKAFHTKIIKKTADDICSLGLWSESGGWLVIGENRSKDGQEDLSVYMTADGGETWEKTAELGRDEPTGAYFFSKSVGVVCYNSKLDEKVPRVYRTEDGGQSWKLCGVELDGIDLEGKYAAASTLWLEEEELMLTVQFSSEDFAAFSSVDEGKTFKLKNMHRGGNEGY